MIAFVDINTKERREKEWEWMGKRWKCLIEVEDGCMHLSTGLACRTNKHTLKARHIDTEGIYIHTKGQAFKTYQGQEGGDGSSKDGRGAGHFV